MIQSLANTDIFKSLSNEIARPAHAYLFYGQDEMLNVEVAKLFAMSIFCGKSACFNCEACKRTELFKNPDLLIIDKPNIQVSDIEGLIDNVQLKPMIYDYKVVLITSSEGMNESSQNKLLKTLEEPNPQVVFVLACTNIEKLLPTIRSRLNKHYIPNIDIEQVANDLNIQGVDVSRFIHCDITLTDAVRMASKQDDETLDMVEKSIYNLKSSSDIPTIVSGLKLTGEQRVRYLQLMLNAINCALTNSVGVFNSALIQHIQSVYKDRVLVKIIELVNMAIRKINANVNFNYVLDELFYNILKEKYLCK